MNRSEADQRMAETKKELSDVNERLRTADTQLSQFELQAADNSAKQDAVEGTRAEVAGLQTKLEALLHRQHLLEARMRELGWVN